MKKFRSKYLWAIWVLLILLSTGPAGADALLYPLPGNLDFDEGTIEVWFAPQADLQPSQGKEGNAYHQFFVPFSLSLPDSFVLSCLVFARGGKSQLGLSCSSYLQRNAMLPVGISTIPNWRAGEAHCVALTWRGTAMAFYLDGKPAGSRNQTLPLSGLPAGQSLIIGSLNKTPTPFLVRAVRISSTAHDPAQITAARPAAALDTLLLDVLDSPPAGKPPVSIAERISGFSGETGATLQGKDHYADSPQSGLILGESH
jgi:hypothetical protein